MKTFGRILTLAAWMLLLSACGWFRPRPTPPPKPTPTAMPSFKEALRQAEQELRTQGTVTLRLHESQINQAIERLLAQQSSSGQTLPVHNVRVYFRDGQIQMYAQVDTDLGTMDAYVALSVYAQNGKVYVQVQKATLGPLPMPGSMLDPWVEKLQAYLEQWSQHYYVEEVQIQDGWLLLKARVR
ncbi:MAG: hypothetical protein GXO36_05845 [Chloroflexi bacterium]|nr:hypothetical protein [Chloroflexota bacterium]